MTADALATSLEHLDRPDPSSISTALLVAAAILRPPFDQSVELFR